ncbi:MBL fold metallo-hydrolase [Arthrobacter sp. GCM10027362]|uniref:MBL fold metallo-hydrolase n=1 Tax=Arthrobacter sp. GCM10027362 TaxID=3273379 RepID=UPI0036273A09
MTDTFPIVDPETSPDVDGGTDGDNARLTFLGTAAGPPAVVGRLGISTVLSVGRRNYLIDCGRGSLTQYRAAGFEMEDLAGIFITHLHADHTIDLIQFPLLYATEFAAPDRITQPLPIVGPCAPPKPEGEPTRNQSWASGAVPVGLRRMLELQFEAFSQSTDFFLLEDMAMNPRSFVDIREIPLHAGASLQSVLSGTVFEPLEIFRDEHVAVQAVPVPHGAVFPAYALRFDTGGTSIVFSGDTAVSDNVVRIASGADCLVHEAAWVDKCIELGWDEAIEHMRTVHTDVADVGAIARRAGVGTLILSHLAPGDPAVVSTEQWNRRLAESTRRHGFTGQAFTAEDLMTWSPAPKGVAASAAS